MRDNTKFLRGLKELKITLSPEQLQQFEQYYDLLIEWNAVMNLTAITEYEEVITKHFLDSLSFVRTELPLNQKSLLDLGTGAGFPGIPLKIAFPELDVLLVDSLNKRILFLERVIEVLKLDQVSALHARAEELGRKEEYREKFDYCVSRAVARLVSLSEYCIPFVKRNGFFVSYKSGKAEEELKEAEYAITVLGAKQQAVVEMLLPESDMERNLIVIKKMRNTPDAYPRAGGKPAKQPLLKSIQKKEKKIGN